ncbi:MAG: BamA/TamA family outer membrane protein [Bacteroidales bacterium]|nr:BamA/TamA family outer membrane protein [Bacteroidales bacterium]
MRRYVVPILFLLALVFASCRTTKFVPDGEYLLNKTKLKVTDTKEVSGSDLSSYLRQKPNSEVFGFWKLQLGVYNLAGKDTANWWNRQMRKIGEAPEIYDENLTAQSMTQIQRAMFNAGYFDARVDTVKQMKKKKLNLTYNITANHPYTLRNYQVVIRQAELHRIATDEQHTLVKPGMLFDSNVLDQERQRITRRMRSMGYFYFEQDFLQFIADSALLSHEVDLQLTLQDYVATASDSLLQRIFTQYTVSEVVFHTEYNQTTFTAADLDTVQRDDYLFSYAGKPMLRQRTLIKTCAIRPGQLYNERDVERTYAALNALGPVKYVNISFVPSSDNELVCIIVLSKAKTHSVSAEVEGTYSAGDWGVAAGVGYTNRNIFRGAEEFSVNGRGSYEWRENGGRAIEAKVDANLRFPNSLAINVAYNYQNRPDEYTRTIANAGLQYNLRSNRSLSHYFTLLDISYIYLPWISEEFSDYFLQNSNPLKYSYEDHFIMDWSYTGNYSSYRSSQPLRNYGTIQYSVETAGNFLYGVSHLFKLSKDENGAYEIFNIPYAQYVKADAYFTYHQIFDKQNRFVYHLDFGVAVPFGNAASIPFEKRYFAGGANSVRGWTMRALGPGGYRGTGNRIDYNNQAGDIRLNLNFEYRVKLLKLLELAFFTDAGNVWTIRDYESQPHGQFGKDFYKQLAWSYGMGIRLDFDFFIFRVDFGVKLYDPSRLYTDGKQWRTAPNGLGWRDDMTFHFAIGYPF